MKRFLLIMLFLVLVLTITNVLYGAVQGWGSCTISIDCGHYPGLGNVIAYCWTPQCNGPHCNAYGGSVECKCDDGFYRSMDCPAMEVPEEWERC